MTDAEFAGLLIEAHQGGPKPTLYPTDEAQAYRVQRLVAPHLGPIGGWKVGAAGPESPPNCAPLPQSGLFEAPHNFSATRYTQREIESEICFRLATSLPPRPTPYSRAEIIAAIANCHPGIEILQSRLANPATATPLALLADNIQHGAYLIGPAIPNWQSINFAELTLTQSISGQPTRHACGNPAGDMIRLLQWLANQGARWAGGLAAGQILTCGSWTGKTHAPVGAIVTTHFATSPPLQATFIP